MPRGGFALLLLAVSLLIPASAPAQNKVEERRVPYPAATQPSAADREAQQRLAKPVGALKFSGDCFQDAIDRLRSDTGLNIYLNWRALKYERVTRALLVTIDLTDLTAASALDKLLEQVGGDWARLGWTLDDGVVTISSRRDLAKNTITRVYDVRKAIGAGAAPAAPAVPAAPAAPAAPANNDRQIAVDRLIARVQGIDPLSWRDAGGDIGSVRELSGQLIITQTPQVHQRIVQELHDIENSNYPFPLISTKKSR